MKIIGSITTHKSTGFFKSLYGKQVKIVAIVRGDEYINTNEHLREIGGVRATDFVEVQPYCEKAGRFSFISSDPDATDLECFAYLVDE